MRATKVQYIEFLSSNIWQDLKREILLELSAVRDDLEDPTRGRDDIKFLQGNAATLRRISDLPQLIIDEWDRLTKDDKEAMEDATKPNKTE